MTAPTRPSPQSVRSVQGVPTPPRVGLPWAPHRPSHPPLVRLLQQAPPPAFLAAWHVAAMPSLCPHRHAAPRLPAGRIMVNVPNDHFGPIPAEADPRGTVRACTAFSSPATAPSPCCLCSCISAELLTVCCCLVVGLCRRVLQGVRVGEFWKDRLDCRQWGAHFPHVAGIAGQSNVGAQSVVLSGG